MNPIAETNHFIVLDNYIKYSQVNEPPTSYQTETALEREFIQDLTPYSLLPTAYGVIILFF